MQSEGGYWDVKGEMARGKWCGTPKNVYAKLLNVKNYTTFVSERKYIGNWDIIHLNFIKFARLFVILLKAKGLKAMAAY
jgi:hypothetical protein